MSLENEHGLSGTSTFKADNASTDHQGINTLGHGHSQEDNNVQAS